MHGIRAAEPGGRVHVLVPASQRARNRDFVRMRRSEIVDPNVIVRGPIRLTTAARSCIDAAFAAPRDEAREAILIEAVQRGIAPFPDLAEWANRLRPRDRYRLPVTVQYLGR